MNDLSRFHGYVVTVQFRENDVPQAQNRSVELPTTAEVEAFLREVNHEYLSSFTVTPTFYSPVPVPPFG